MALDPSHVAAALVTRGDVELQEIIGSIHAAGIDEVVVWDNSRRPFDVKCLGRFFAAAATTGEWIYTQDDDLLAPVDEILASIDPLPDYGSVVANNRAEEEWRLLGIGSVWHRSLLAVGKQTVQRYAARYGVDDDVFRAADVIFAYTNPYRKLVLGYENLPWGYATPESPRMYGQPDHMQVRERVRERTLAL